MQYHSKLFLPRTKSMLSKHLTKEIWEEYRDKECEEGVPFKLCVFSGIKNQDAGIGCYAGSLSSYKIFGKLFDKVIEELHGYKATDSHKCDMDYEKIKMPDLSPEQQAMITTVRSRVTRNFEGYPTCIGLSKSQRI